MLISAYVNFVVGNLLSVLAPGYWSLLAARLVTSLNHGAFFGLGSVVAANLVPKEKQASAVATMFMGLLSLRLLGSRWFFWRGQSSVSCHKWAEYRLCSVFSSPLFPSFFFNQEFV